MGCHASKKYKQPIQIPHASCLVENKEQEFNPTSHENPLYAIPRPLTVAVQEGDKNLREHDPSTEINHHEKQVDQTKIQNQQPSAQRKVFDPNENPIVKRRQMKAKLATQQS